MGSKLFAHAAAVGLGLALVLPCAAQVVAVNKVKDPQGQLLQQRGNGKVGQRGGDAGVVRFPFPCYSSDPLDIAERRQKQLPQGSVHFDRFNGQLLLQITGNYYVSYSARMLTPNRRARKTFEDVVLPLLKIAVARIDRTVAFDGFGFEIAHHVRNTVLKVDTEGAENLVLVVPRGVAERLVYAKDAETEQGALLESEVYLNGEPLTLWLTGDEAPADVKDHYLPRRDHKVANAAQAPAPQPETLLSPHLIPESELLTRVRDYARTPHDVSPAKLEKLETQYGGTARKLVTDLNAQAHFVEYAPPAFIAFRDGAYLQLKLATGLEHPGGS